MNVYKIRFLKKADAPPDDDTLELLWDYLGSLYKNGQILRNYELIDAADELFSCVTLTDDDALNEAHNNVYTKEYKEKLCEKFEIEHSKMGRNMDQDDACACENPSWYMLYTDYSLTESPVVCGDCGRAVPLYKLPHIHDHDHYKVVSWQEAYKSIDRLWCYCLADRFTLRQLHDPMSQLSLDGRDLCKAFEEKTGKPFYYYLFQNKATSKKCPLCQNEWKREKDTFIDYRCDACWLVTDDV